MASHTSLRRPITGVDKFGGSTHAKQAQPGIAIVGIGCRFPGRAGSPAAFWRPHRDGVDAITELPGDRFEPHRFYDADPASPGKLYARWGGFVDGIDRFDADFFGISPREARRIDPQQRLLLKAVWEALEDGGLVPDQLAGTRTGVFIGLSTHDYSDVQIGSFFRDRIDAHSNIGVGACIAANRISYAFDLRGPSLAVDTACSSSLTALHLACQSLGGSECELTIVGGANALSVSRNGPGRCRGAPFGSRRQSVRAGTGRRPLLPPAEVAPVWWTVGG